MIGDMRMLVRRARHPRLWQCYLAVGTLGTVLYALVPPFAGSGPLINGLGLSGVAAILVGVRRNQPASKRPWWFFAVGIFLFWVGDLYTYSYPRLFHVSVPFPSIGDGIYLTVYPALMMGLLLLFRRRNPGPDRAGVIDSVIMTLGLSLVSFIVLIAPYVHDNTLSLVPKLVSIAYPLGDVLLLAAAIRLAVDTGKRRPAFYLLASSIVTLLVTDFAYGLYTLHNAYTHQVILDVGWISFYLFWGAAALHPSMGELEEAEPDRDARLSPLRLALLGAASLIAPVIEITKVKGGDVDQLVVISASVVLFAFVVVRMGGLVRQRERSVLRERDLTAAGVALLAATSRDQIFDAARDAVRPLTDSDTSFWLFGVEGARVTLVATDGDRTADPSGDSMSHPTATALMVASARGASLAAVIPEVVRIELGIATGSSAVVMPLVAGNEICGLLLVATESSLAPTSRTALQALATQVSMALGSALLTEEIHRRTSEARFTSLVQRATDLITVLDANAMVVYQSPSIERVLGYAPEAIIGTRFDRLLVGGKETRLLRLLADGSVFGAGETQVVECSLTHSDGSQRDFEMLYTNLLDDDSVGGVVLNGRDISERKAFEHQLEHQAFHDPVTDLPNRALFNERVRHAVARARREEHGLAVIFVDLDDFKTVNDSLGHAAGDRVLNEVAKRLDTSIRASDTAARFGGDEFTVLLEGVQGPGVAAETAERIVESIGQPILLEQKEILLRASLGISVLEAGVAGDADELIRNADAAMYIAKRDGKGEYRLFEPAMHEEVLTRLELRGDLQRALSDDQFELHYQPLIRLSDRAVIGLEALIRWRHPERGLVQPGDFIPFAEETGLIVPIGRWVLREGCRAAKRMQDRVPADPPLSMSINLSVKQLHHSDIVGDVRDALAESGLDPASLTLEITETVMMTDADQAEERLTELKALGVRLAMDDFGTGYSSLSYLSRFPVDVLKMDRSFLPAGELPVASGLATAVLGLGETFDFEVLAEGIELTEQWTALRDLGFELGQGFYFAKPMDAAATLEYLQTFQSEHALLSPPGPSADATQL